MKHVTLIRLPLILAMWIVLAGGAAAARDTRTVAPATLARILSAPRVTPTVGAPHGDVTMVEYFDYNCPVCRELEPRLRELLGADPAVRLVRKDWAIFGEGSVCAAYASFGGPGGEIPCGARRADRFVPADREQDGRARGPRQSAARDPL